MRVQMHGAVCTDCGSNCQVPFEPTDTKPVYCKHCFKRDEASREVNSDRKMYRATCTDCGGDCNVPFKPSASKPIYCDPCFNKDDSEKKPKGPSPKSDKTKKKLNDMDKKLDLIIELLQGRDSEEG